MIANPVKQDITVYKDRDFYKEFIIKDSTGALLDISDWVASSQIRTTYESNTVIADMVITIDLLTSSIVIELDSATTLAISKENPITLGSKSTTTNMVWDLVIDTIGGERFTLITGICNFTNTVTRAVS